MKTVHTIEAYREWRSGFEADVSIGFVPTMGALHAGHLELIKRSVDENDETVVSIFVNPTQFNDPKDCETYPTPLESDLKMCADAGVGIVFLPEKTMLYPDDYRFRLTENKESLVLEGEKRPGHFDGVLTVVMKLLQIVQAQKAYFGEKDWQQLSLVRDMAKAFFLPVTVLSHPTVRESDGLAMSSRNARLKSSVRRKAGQFNFYLKNSATQEEAEAHLKRNGFEVEYVADVNGRRLSAVLLDGVRLIDNISLIDESEDVK